MSWCQTTYSIASPVSRADKIRRVSGFSSASASWSASSFLKGVQLQQSITLWNPNTGLNLLRNIQQLGYSSTKTDLEPWKMPRTSKKRDAKLDITYIHILISSLAPLIASNKEIKQQSNLFIKKYISTAAIFGNCWLVVGRSWPNGCRFERRCGRFQ